MKDLNTSWSHPSTTWLGGINNLRKALASGIRAVLMRGWNADCLHPILDEFHDRDFRNYEFQIGRAASRDSIRANKYIGEFEKLLSLHYITLYGTPEAMDHYYATGELSKDNDLSTGKSHLVRASDFITYLLETQQKQRARKYQLQYQNNGNGSESTMHFYSFYRYKHGSKHAPKKFKRKVWVVVTLDKDEKLPRTPVAVNILSALAHPFKYIPKRKVLAMPDYKCVTYSVGSVQHGYSVEFNIPKKFSF